MVDDNLKKSVIKDIAFLKAVGIKPIIVHGGGPKISKAMEKNNITPNFINGLRVTDQQTINIVKEVFKEINNEIKSMLNDNDIVAESIQTCLQAEKKNEKLGFVGNVIGVDTEKIISILDKDKIPIISPLGYKDSQYYNINADTAATKLAIALNAEKLTILTNVDGVIINEKLISNLSIDDTIKNIKQKIITKGMIPKVQACIEAVEAGCQKAHLINGTVHHSLLFEIFTQEGIGTEIVKNGSKKIKGN